MSKRQSVPDPIDVRIGETVRNVRTTRGMSMEALGHKIGVSYQQIQQYETGGNRIAAAMLYRIARALRCDLGTLFVQSASGVDHGLVTMRPDEEDTRSALALARIEDPAVRDAMRQLIDRLGYAGNLPRRD